MKLREFFKSKKTFLGQKAVKEPVAKPKNHLGQKYAAALGLIISIGVSCLGVSHEENQTIAANPIAQKSIPTNHKFNSTNATEVIPTWDFNPPVFMSVESESEPQPKTYQVKPGDTISLIASAHGISPTELVKANQISNPNLIQVNQKLIIETPKRQQLLATKNSQKLPASYSFNAAQLKLVSFPSPPQESTPTESITQPYREKLLAEILELRRQYQQDNENNNSPAQVTKQLNNPVSLHTQVVNFQGQNPSSTEPPMHSSLNTPASLNMAILGETIEPELPPLLSPERYLPEYTPEEPVFNGYIWPAKGTFTSGFGWRRGRMHNGLDIAAPIGTPIIAAASGEVIYAGWNSGGYGNLVKIRHPDGNITLYAHNTKILVRRGQQVKQGQQISTMGTTGNSTGSHLHFEIHPRGQRPVNPIAYLP
ncbi:MAG: M23 family metallopeptidase [Gomphosphaeria aponina SAG 52.96 = DSM 107014]|uniref:M23 family metallopeptidase n=1 Tax=Gomphosphaeria aponina SAG 52.96 = DSM 107014 TaxID=1521640 RepID=A0A941JS30_9CHRO|nr:M23 family metallopeptidase [Gomphosphaeria aponina SAG 52.96 = DSM 107014]